MSQKKGLGVQSAQIEQIPTADLIPYARNSRTHSDEQVAQIAASIREFGFCNPVLIDAENTIIAGHGRVLAAGRMKLETVPCLRLTHLTDAQRRAYVIADNRIALSSGWDSELLANELSDLHADDFDMALLGFDADELSELMGFELEPESAEIVEDEVPDPPADPITKPGDLWILGEHRLLCGDSTKAADVGRLMAGAKADLWLTDPPYNIAYDGGSKLREVIENDSMSSEEFREWLRSVFMIAFGVMKPGASFYIWHADSEGYNFRGAVIDSKQKTRQSLVWVKNNSTFGRQDYHWQHEPCLYGWKDGAAHGWYTDRKQTTILSFDRPSRSDEHPTMKPVALIAYQVGNSTAPQGLVYDSFLGSGTTLIAAEQLGRKCYGMEISPAYCDVIVARWEKLTGKKATLDGQQALQEA